MTLVYLESGDAGFEDQQLYGGPNNYSSRNSIPAAAQTGTYGFDSAGISGFPPGMSDIIFGYATKDTPNVQGGQLYSDSNSVFHGIIRYGSDGTVEYAPVGTGAAAVKSSPGAYIPGNRHYFEFRVKIHDTLGEVEMRVDGATVASASGIDTRNGGTGQIDTIRSLLSDLDDFYVIHNDGSGLTDFLGPIRIETLRPNGNGFYSQLLGSDGNSVDNYLQVNAGDRENNIAAETTYNGSSTPGDKDTYAMEDLPAYVATVLAVEGRFIASKSDVAVVNGRAVARRAGVDAVSPDQALSLDPASIRWVLEQDPTDSSAWTKAKVDAMEFGFEVRA